MRRRSRGWRNLEAQQNGGFGKGHISIPNIPISSFTVVNLRNTPPPPLKPLPVEALLSRAAPGQCDKDTEAGETVKTTINRQHQKWNQVYLGLVQKQQSVLIGTQPPVVPLTLQLDHKSGLRGINWSFENWQTDYRKYIFSL